MTQFRKGTDDEREHVRALCRDWGTAGGPLERLKALAARALQEPDDSWMMHPRTGEPWHLDMPADDIPGAVFLGRPSPVVAAFAARGQGHAADAVAPGNPLRRPIHAWYQRFGVPPPSPPSHPQPGFVCETCFDAPATIVQPAPWGGEMGVCAACAARRGEG